MSRYRPSSSLKEASSLFTNVLTELKQCLSLARHTKDEREKQLRYRKSNASEKAKTLSVFLPWGPRQHHTLWIHLPLPMPACRIFFRKRHQPVSSPNIQEENGEGVLRPNQLPILSRILRSFALLSCLSSTATPLPHLFLKFSSLTSMPGPFLLGHFTEGVVCGCCSVAC